MKWKSLGYAFATAGWTRFSRSTMRVIGRLNWPVLFKEILLPTIPTLVGVYVALWLENGRQRSEEKEKAVSILTIAVRECQQVEQSLKPVNLDQGPTTLPTIGISLLNILQQPALLKGLHTEDFEKFVTYLGGLRRSSEEYQRLALRFYTIEASPITQFAPALLPIPVGQPLPATPAEAQAMAARGRAELEGNKKARLNEATAALARALSDYSSNISGFCRVTEVAKHYLE